VVVSWSATTQRTSAIGRLTCGEVLQTFAAANRAAIVPPSDCYTDTASYDVRNILPLDFIRAWGFAHDLELRKTGDVYYFRPFKEQQKLDSLVRLDSVLFRGLDTIVRIPARDTSIWRLRDSLKPPIDYLLIVDEIASDSVYNRGVKYTELLGSFSRSGYSLSAVASVFYGRYSTDRTAFHAIPITLIDTARVEWGTTVRDTSARIDLNGSAIQQFSERIVGDVVSLRRQRGLIHYTIKTKQVSDGYFAGQILEGGDLRYSREMRSINSGWSWFPFIPFRSDKGSKVVSSVYLLPYPAH